MQHDADIVMLPVAESTELQAPKFSQDALALRFADLLHGELRYCAAWGKWLVWGGTRWREDDTLGHVNFARDICRKGAAECDSQREAKALASANTVWAVHRLAGADRRLAVRPDQFDCNTWLLNTPNVTIDLRTGDQWPHRKTDYITKMTSVSPEGDCPLWLQFLDRVTDGDVELQAFLQRMCGYCLTGSTQEHALFFLYGLGANGKTVFLEAISGILFDYAKTAPIETFVHSHSDRHPTEIAALRGARMVSASETSAGRRWAVSRIKALTGGDKVAARFMRQDFFVFTPAFKLVIAGNHRPALRAVDEAIRRRFHLVPFTVTIPEHERDPELGEKLKRESPGILAWMISGCDDWLECGLEPPEAVKAATEAYLDSQDAIGAWLDECCQRDGRVWTSSAELYLSWKVWADQSGEFVGSQKKFADRLESKGFVPQRKMTARGFVGLYTRQE